VNHKESHVDNNGHVLVIGASNLDIKGQPLSPRIAGTSNPAIIRTSLGGVARNIAENLARLEVATILFTGVGDDEAGERILNQAAVSGVDISQALTVPGERTGAYMAVLTNEGNLDFGLDDMSILSGLTPHYFAMRESFFANARLVVMDANLAPDSLAAVADLCSRHAVPLCADPTSTILAERLRPHLRSMHMTSPNIYEAQVLSNDALTPSDREAAQKAASHLVALGVDIAVITLGEHGAVYADDETFGHIPAIVGQVVDSTGAGDAMTAAIIFGILEGIPLDESVGLGVTAATLTMRSRETVRPDLSVDLLYDELVI
jgi:pseudouridine kinase